MLLACERDAATGVAFNIASGRQTSILELAETLNQVMGTRLKPDFAPARAGEVRFSEGDAQRALQVLGWEAITPLRDGLSRLTEMKQG